ncbi:DNA helicase II [Thermithiobacillus plumbiphilus]|uniref:DNA 3'-5' helicase n=1 Tax=Thermithiobacillus plumbiphilus TaxID=1729899 RepID=A0ABU9D7V5_9PROT
MTNPSLNPRQLAAVTLPGGPALVLAGAGSGKTRVLTHRIAHLVESGLSPREILAVTFTNKAAAEMRERTSRLLDVDVRSLWVGTFHGLAHRLLRMHHGAVGLPENFQILDSDDQLRLVKRVLRELGLDEKAWPPRMLAGLINRWKDEGLAPDEVATEDGLSAQGLRVYRAYEALKMRAGLVDFADLLLYALRLWRDPAILQQYQQRFRHVLVDEFQDTNLVQYHWLRTLAEAHGNLFVVGDDDQAIYGWRGARVENLLRFGEDFRGTTLIRLEQNYRSTQTILDAANAVISFNPDRMGKTLWTDSPDQSPIQLYAAYSEVDEARYVVSRIQQWVAAGGRHDECAILYRANAQSRAFEEVLVQQGMPYRVYGGLRFFDRAEVKDALAYLRLLHNRHDDAAFERVVNVPARGIGPGTLDQLRAVVRDQGISLWQAAGLLGGAPGRKLAGFLNLIDELAQRFQDQSLDAMIAGVIQDSGLRDWYARQSDRAEAREENLDELITAARVFRNQASLEPEMADRRAQLQEFLTHAALEAGEGQAEAWSDCVHLMSLHSAKGLEFPLVFLVGLEEGLFPHMRSLEDSKGMMEERRLCYVGMTRAMRQLVLSYAESRRLHGTERSCLPSRFLRDIPGELIEELRPRPRVSRPVYDDAPRMAQGSGAVRQLAADLPFPLGSRIRHPVFGEGMVLNYEGGARQGRIQINFESVGVKWLALGVVKLELV